MVDDDPELRTMLTTYLGQEGYGVRGLADGGQLLARLGIERPDLLVLDQMLPGQDGLTLLRSLRDGGDDLPVLMLTARGDAVDRIIGLEQGADDYMAKPFLPRELSARIAAVLRRRQAGPVGAPQRNRDPVAFGELKLDLEARQLERHGELVPITSGEFALLAVFVDHPHRPLSREFGAFDRSIDVQISRLRRLVEPDPSRPRYLQTVWGYGYVFVPDGQPRR